MRKRRWLALGLLLALLALSGCERSTVIQATPVDPVPRLGLLTAFEPKWDALRKRANLTQTYTIHGRRFEGGRLSDQDVRSPHEWGLSSIMKTRRIAAQKAQRTDLHREVIMSETFLGAQRPSLHATVYVAPGAQIVGAVTLAEEVNIWFNVVLRGDVERITVRARTNIQDGSVAHASYGFPVLLGNGVTVGHNAIVHGATVGPNTLVGMGAMLLDGVNVGENCIVAAGSLLTEGKQFPSGSLILGTPARVVRPLTTEEIEHNRQVAERYVKRAQRYRNQKITPVEP